jgi:predicted enzyme related to lactoylglutathione lyase
MTLEVDDGAAAAAFHARLLGIPGRFVGGGRHYFDCGDVVLALLDAGRPARAQPEIVYFAAADVDAVLAAAETLGCLDSGDVHGAPAGAVVRRPWGERSFYAIDPTGNRLCFVDESTVFNGR